MDRDSEPLDGSRTQAPTRTPLTSAEMEMRGCASLTKAMQSMRSVSALSVGSRPISIHASGIADHTPSVSGKYHPPPRYPTLLPDTEDDNLAGSAPITCWSLWTNARSLCCRATKSVLFILKKVNTAMYERPSASSATVNSHRLPG